MTPRPPSSGVDTPPPTSLTPPDVGGGPLTLNPNLPAYAMKLEHDRILALAKELAHALDAEVDGSRGRGRPATSAALLKARYAGLLP